MLLWPTARPDLKTLKEKSKQTKSEKKLKQALTYELWRSLRAVSFATNHDEGRRGSRGDKNPQRSAQGFSASRCVASPSRHRRDSSPSEKALGGLFSIDPDNTRHAVMVREACQLLVREACPNVSQCIEIGVHGSLRAPSRHRRDSCPSHNEVGGFSFDFEPFRTGCPTFRDHAGLRVRDHGWLWL